MKRVLVLFGVLICMLSFVACDKATGSEAPVTSGIITRTEEDKIYDLTEEPDYIEKIFYAKIKDGSTADRTNRKAVLPFCVSESV